MQKVYRLLRNNRETGPYSLEEILQLNLKSFDLVWVEGRSAAWRYPSEIDTLKTFVPEAPKPQTPFEPVATAAMESETVPQPQLRNDPPKKIFVSMPVKSSQENAPVEQRETRHISQPSFEPKVQKFSEPINPYSGQIPETEPVRTNYARSLDEVEEEYTSWIYQNKASKKSGVSKKDLLVAAVIVVLILGGYFIISRPSIVEPLTRQTAPTFKNQPQEKTAVTENGNSNPQDATPSEDISLVQKKKSARAIQSTVSENTGETNGIHPVEILKNDDPKEEVSGDQNETVQKEDQPENTKEKKKKLGEVIRGIFSKKDKKETAKNDPVAEEPLPSTNRQATKRSETTENDDATSNADLAEMIDLSSNAPENWMMGVTGLKVTLRNRNNISLQTAAVQVLYYDENDQVIDRKNIYFNNVPARGRITIAAPDHKFADHVEFKLAAVTPKEDRYANN